MAQSEWVDYYALLELYDPVHKTGKGPDSTVQEIKEAWKLLLSAWHPDKFRGEARSKAEERSKYINAAYDELRNPEQKKTYDAQWIKKNAWFHKEQETKSTAFPEIAVRWDPPDALTTLFFDIPRGEKRRAKLVIEPRVGRGFVVEIEEPASGWLKVVEPKDKRGTPPFTAVIEVDTTNLQPEQPYSGDLLFWVE